MDIQTCAEILGHSRLTTALIYAHTSTERKAKAVEVISVGAPAGHRPSDVVLEVADK